MSACSVCQTPTRQRCSRCKQAFFCSAACQKRAWGVHRRVCQAPGSAGVVQPVASAEEQLRTAVQSSLASRGWCVVRGERPEIFGALISAWRDFFARPAAAKNAFRTESLRGGYMTPHPGLHEVFEHKTGNRDEAFRCPCEKATAEAFAWCEQLALLALRIMVEHCRPGTWSAKRFLPDSTLRILHYDRAVPGVSEQALCDAFPEHTDSSLVTVAPKSTMAALEMKRFDTGVWECVEDHMSDNDVIIFVGDSGAYLSGNRFPAPLHRPGVSRMLAGSPPGSRISTPFFLRGRKGLVLDPPGLQPLPVEYVEDNVGGCRDRMPWKLNGKYYNEMKYS